MPLPPVKDVLDVSLRFLQDMELAARNRAANTRKRLRHEIEALIEQEVEADVAHWFIDHRPELDKLLRSGAIEVNPHKVEFFDRKEKKSA